MSASNCEPMIPTLTLPAIFLILLLRLSWSEGQNVSWQESWGPTVESCLTIRSVTTPYDTRVR